MSAALAPLPPDDGSYELVYMLTTSRAVDLFLGDLTRRSRSESGRTADSYRRLLDKFTDTLRPDEDVTCITADDCRRFLDMYARRSAGYQSVIYSVLNSFLEWVYQQQRIKKNPLDHVPRPRRIPPSDLDVVTVSVADVPRLIAAASSHTERLAIAIPAYMGPRRRATASLRLRDYDRPGGRIRFHEKGSKTIWKPVPHELAALIEWAIRDGAIKDPDDYLVPAEGPLSRAGERDDRVIWRAVKKVADGIGVEAHVHALRAAFATFYLQQNIGDVEALQALMGHRSIATTQVYLRKLDREAAMERVRDLSWDSIGVPGGSAGVGEPGRAVNPVPRAESVRIAPSPSVALDDNAEVGGLPLFAGERSQESSHHGKGHSEPPFVEPEGPERHGTEPTP